MNQFHCKVCVSLITVLIISNNIYSAVCQVQQDVYFNTLIEMNARLIEAYDNLNNTSVNIEAKEVIQFSVELILKNFPKLFSQSAGTFMQVLSELLQTSFRHVNDDVLVDINADDVELEDIKKILSQQKESTQVVELVRAILSQEVFLNQVEMSLKLGLLEREYLNYIDTYGDVASYNKQYYIDTYEDIVSQNKYYYIDTYEDVASQNKYYYTDTYENVASYYEE